MSSNKKWYQNKFLWGLVILIVLLLVLKLWEQKDKDVLIPMTNVQLETFLAEKKSGFIYVGRPTCPVCKEFQPKLIKEVKDNKAEVHYYNTDEGRKEDEEQMIEMLNELNIKTVPALLYLKDGVEVERIDEGRFEQADIKQLMDKYIPAS